MIRRLLWMLGIAAVVLVIVPAAVLLPYKVQEWLNSRPTIPPSHLRRPMKVAPTPSQQTTTSVEYGPRVVVDTRSPAPPKLKSDYPADGPSVLVCAPMPTAGDADAKAIGIGLHRVLEWKMTNLLPLYAQVPTRFTQRAMRQLHISSPLTLSKEQAMRLADFVGHNFAVYGTIRRSGSVYTVELKVLDVLEQKDVGDPIKLEGTATELLQREGAAALEIAQRMKLKLSSDDEKWLQTPVATDPEALRIVATKMPVGNRQPMNEATLKRLQQVAPNWILANLWRIENLMRQKKHEDAVRQARALSEEYPDLPAARFAYFDALIRTKDYGLAEKEAQNLPKPLQESFRGIYARQVAYAMVTEGGNEYQFTYTMKHLNPRAPFAYLTVHDDPEACVRHWHEKHEGKQIEKEADTEHYVHLFAAFVEVGQPERARALLKKFIPKIPSEELPVWAEDFRGIKAYGEELMFYEEGLRHKRDSRLLEQAAQCYLRMGNSDRAQALYDGIINMGRSKEVTWYSKALMGRALCRMAQGQQQAAVADYSAALQLHPSMTGVFKVRREKGEWSYRMFQTFNRIVQAAGGTKSAASPLTPTPTGGAQ